MKKNKLLLLSLLCGFIPVITQSNDAIADDNKLKTNIPATLNYKVESDISLENLAKLHNTTPEILISLNKGNLASKQKIKKGTNIVLPSPVSIEEVSSIGTNLPVLNSGNNTINSTAALFLNETPVNSVVNSSTESNIAQLSSKAATTNWNEISTENIQEDAKEWAQGKLQSAVNNKINTTASDFLGRFGKAEVNIQLNSDGEITNSQINVLSPLYDNKEQLIFSQAGIHGQGQGNTARTIGNFGLGYRYDADNFLTGGNVFIDHDFTGSNTRLGLGGEFWVDYAKVSSNAYLPISSWKTSDVMQNYEKLVYDERPAKGFDIRGQGYLPSYPQLGGSVVYEQYFGDEVDLFGIEDRQKDPYAVSLGLDYTPIPLVTSGITHKMGKSGLNETSFDLNLNLQLGTPLEEQINPAKVAEARSMKGSRYDIVDRNYDIVFEYKQEDFALEITGPIAVSLGQVASYNVTKKQSRAKITEYKWIVTNSLGNTQEYIGDSFNFIPQLTGSHTIVLQVTTERGYVGQSNQITLTVGSTAGSTIEAVDNTVAEVLNTADYQNFRMLETAGYNPQPYEKIQIKFTPLDSNGNLINLITPPLLQWRKKGDQDWIKLNPQTDNGIYSTIGMKDESTGSYSYTLVASYDLLNGLARSAMTESNIEIMGYSDINLAVASEPVTLTFTEKAAVQVNANNLIMELTEVSPANGQRSAINEVVSRNGYENGVAISDAVRKPIKVNSYYEAKVYTYDTKAQKRIDVTDTYQHSIRWVYYDQINNTEVSILDSNGYRALEACQGYPIFHTQQNNFADNELAWGQIAADSSLKNIANEQGLILAFKVDLSQNSASTTNEIRTGEAKYCQPVNDVDNTVLKDQQNTFANWK